MNTDFDDAQIALRASVRGFLDVHAPLSSVRASLEQGRADRNVWKGLSALGITGLLVPEDLGGSAATCVDAAAVGEACGRALFVGPFVEAAIGAATLLQAARRTAVTDMALRDLAEGTATTVPALFDAGTRHAIDRTRSTAQDGFDATVFVTGSKSFVVHAAFADRFVVTATDELGRLDVVLVEAADAADTVIVVDEPILDATRPTSKVEFRSAPGVRLLVADPALAVRTALDRMMVATVNDSVGAAERVLELTVDYANERMAFGQPIGSFQAIQHLAADMLRAVELARAAGYYAAWALDHLDGAAAHLATLQAAAYANAELPVVGESAIQVFGGIGFTWEHDAHLFYKRLVAASALFGTADDHLSALADIVLPE